MLELRPSCEHCNKNLPPESTEVMICTYECTFCKDCVEKVLKNVCPNCGGGFCQRPNRPKNNLRDDNFLGADPASNTIVHKPIDIKLHQEFAKNIQSTPAHKR